MYKCIALAILLSTTHIALAADDRPEKDSLDQMIERFDESLDSLTKRNGLLEDLTEDLSEGFSGTNQKLQEFNQVLQDELRDQKLLSDTLNQLSDSLDSLETYIDTYHYRLQATERKFWARMKTTHCRVPMSNYSIRVVYYLDIRCSEEEI